MGVVTRAYSEIDGNVAQASSVNRVIDDLYTLVNGNLNSANIIASGVRAVNIGDSSVVQRTIGDTAILARSINDGAAIARTIGYDSILLIQEAI